jgi:hypothetical protein
LQLSLGVRLQHRVAHIEAHFHTTGAVATRKRSTSKAADRVHTVRATLDVGELARAGNSLHLELAARGQKLGRLEIGRGALYWTGRNRRTRKRISWSKFADMMDGLTASDIR